MTTIRSWIGASLGLIPGFLAPSAEALDFVVPTAGHVTLEYVSADSAFINTLSVAVAAPQSVSVALNGCKQVPTPGLGGVQLLSATVSRSRCRVELDSDPVIPGIQGFPAGTVLRFQICPQAPGDSTCRNVWSSNPAQNSDLSEHVLTSSSGSTTLLRWEDLARTPGSSDDDFNDLIVAIHVNGDADGDGIWDDWEQQQQQLGGIDLDGDGMPDLILPGANPMHKDLYVRIDYMDCNVAGSDCAPGDTHSHRPLDAAIQEVINAFALVPALKPDGTLLNPDGLPGINLHIGIGNAVAHQTYLNIPDLCFSNLPGVDNFDTAKARNFPQTDPRAIFYHYGLFSHQQALGATSSGCAEMPGNDFQVSLGGWNIGAGDIDGDGIADDGVGSISQQAGTLMHELGHNLGLRHGGSDDTNYKPNYLSVMNYSFQMDGIPTNDPIANPFVFGRVDYARRALAPLDELNLQELPGLGAGNDNTLIFCPDTFPAIQPGSGFIDWNCNGRRDCSINPVTRVPVCTPIASDVNLDGICVSAGRNGRLNSLPALDDRTLFGFYITDGANRTCDTIAVPDDEQISPPGKTHPRILTSFSDWPNLKYDFQNTRNFEDGTHIADADQTEISYELYLQRTAADLVVSQIASPGAVVAGSNVIYQIDLINRGLPPARNIVVKDILPAAATLVSC